MMSLHVRTVPCTPAEFVRKKNMSVSATVAVQNELKDTYVP